MANQIQKEQAGRYQPYPEYKDSGVEWLGKIPNHWQIFSLKRAVEKCINGIWGSEANGKDDLVVLRVADFNRDQLVIDLSKLTYRAITQSERENRLLQKGDLLIEKSGGGDKTLVGCVVIYDYNFPAVTSNFVGKMTPLKNFSGNFLNYAFNKLYSENINFLSIKQTTGIQNLDTNAYLSEYFCFPPLQEQTQIAQFLDYETAKINLLIEKQQKLIELLKEKRQAVISHAVTKGLDPNVEMKDSGVEWLGEMPAHWEVLRLKYIGESIIGLTYSPSDVVDDAKTGILVLRSSNIQDKKLSFKDNVYVNKYIPDKLRTRKNDLLICARNGSRALIGKNTLIDDSAIDLTFGAFMTIFRSLYNEYIFYVFNSSLFEYQSSTFLTSTINQLTTANLNSFEVPIPSFQEQQQIIQYLKYHTSKIDLLIEKAEAQITLMQERRTALISAAVTGKIDLRHWQMPEVSDHQGGDYE